VIAGAAGKEVGRQVLMDGETLPTAPAGGKLKTVPISRIFANQEFGYRTITVERPLRDTAGKPLRGEKGKLKGKPQPDSSLRDTENVPLWEDVQAYFQREVLPHAPDAWIDHDKPKVGYEIPVTDQIKARTTAKYGTGFRPSVANAAVLDCASGWDRAGLWPSAGRITGPSTAHQRLGSKWVCAHFGNLETLCNNYGRRTQSARFP